MVAAKINAIDSRIDENNVFAVDKGLSLLKTAAIYGANNSGKSNLVQALLFMRRLVLNSSRETQSGDPIDVEAFRLGADMVSKPSFFEVVFLLDKKKYRYGFEVNREHIVSEWLFFTPANREARLFTREKNGFLVSEAFKEGKGIAQKTRENALFLSVVAQFNGTIAEKVLKWFREIGVVSGLSDIGLRDYTVQCFDEKKEQQKEDILKLLKRFDLGFDRVEIEEMPLTSEYFSKVPDLPKPLITYLLKGKPTKSHVKVYHKKYDSNGITVSFEPFDLDENESDGTKKIFSLAGPLARVLKTGLTLVIDEFDARLHPLITSSIIALFHSKETNPKNAQLIFTTHDTNLLDNRTFRRDQIWFIEKNKQGASDLYSLAEFKVRNDASFCKDYIQGRYGAIPFIGDITRLTTDVKDEQ